MDVLDVSPAMVLVCSKSFTTQTTGEAKPSGILHNIVIYAG